MVVFLIQFYNLCWLIVIFRFFNMLLMMIIIVQMLLYVLMIVTNAYYFRGRRPHIFLQDPMLKPHIIYIIFLR